MRGRERKAAAAGVSETRHLLQQLSHPPSRPTCHHPANSDAAQAVTTSRTTVVCSGPDQSSFVSCVCCELAMSDIRNLFAKSHIRKRQRLDPASAEIENTSDAEPSTSASQSVPSAALYDVRVDQRPGCDDDVPAEALAVDFEQVFGC